MKILHLEDNPRDAELVHESLRDEWPDCEIETVDRKDDYLAGLERGGDVILSDFSLVNFNGLEALALARNKAPDKQFIFISGMIGEERALEALRAGAAGIAHDFNNVLTPILLGVSLLKKTRAPSEAKILATMEASANRGA